MRRSCMTFRLRRGCPNSSEGLLSGEHELAAFPRLNISIGILSFRSVLPVAPTPLAELTASKVLFLGILWL